MNERDSACLSQYPLEIIHIKKARGGLICEDNVGNQYMLMECPYSQRRIIFEQEVLSQLQSQKEIIVDYYLPNKENELITKEPNGNCYLLKKWNASKKCDVKNKEEVKKAIRALAILHKNMRMVVLDKEVFKQTDLLKQWEKHYNEMKRTRSFIRKKKKKSSLEMMILNTIDENLLEAKDTIEKLKNSKFKQNNQYLCHGDYNYHHVLFSEHGVMVTQFHRLSMGYQVCDVYHFIRKVLEKNNWDIELARELIIAYELENKLNRDEKDLLYLNFLFPYKYWKQINHYMNSSKTWIPERYLIKLKEVCIQQQKRKEFLVKFTQVLYNKNIKSTRR